MRSSGPVQSSTAKDVGAAGAAQRPAAATAPAPAATDQERAALGPIAQPVSAAENPLPVGRADTRAEAEGRRTLSTAFVRVGPDGRLTVELRSGRVLELRNVVMRAKDYCGDQAGGGRYCGGYADVATARPGDAPAGGQR